MPNPSSVIEWWESCSEQAVKDEFAKRWPDVLATSGGVPAMRKRIIKTLLDEFDEEM